MSCWIRNSWSCTSCQRSSWTGDNRGGGTRPAGPETIETAGTGASWPEASGSSTSWPTTGPDPVGAGLGTAGRGTAGAVTALSGAGKLVGTYLAPASEIQTTVPASSGFGRSPFGLGAHILDMSRPSHKPTPPRLPSPSKYSVRSLCSPCKTFPVACGHDGISSEGVEASRSQQGVSTLYVNSLILTCGRMSVSR